MLAPFKKCCEDQIKYTDGMNHGLWSTIYVLLPLDQWKAKGKEKNTLQIIHGK